MLTLQSHLHFHRYLKSMYPKADDTIILDVLANTENNIQKATTKLIEMGYEKKEMTPAPHLAFTSRKKDHQTPSLLIQPTPPPKPKTADEKRKCKWNKRRRREEKIIEFQFQFFFVRFLQWKPSWRVNSKQFLRKSSPWHSSPSTSRKRKPWGFSTLSCRRIKIKSPRRRSTMIRTSRRRWAPGEFIFLFELLIKYYHSIQFGSNLKSWAKKDF